MELDAFTDSQQLLAARGAPWVFDGDKSMGALMLKMSKYFNVRLAQDHEPTLHRYILLSTLFGNLVWFSLLRDSKLFDELYMHCKEQVRQLHMKLTFEVIMKHAALRGIITSRFNMDLTDVEPIIKPILYVMSIMERDTERSASLGLAHSFFDLVEGEKVLEEDGLDVRDVYEFADAAYVRVIVGFRSVNIPDWLQMLIKEEMFEKKSTKATVRGFTMSVQDVPQSSCKNELDALVSSKYIPMVERLFGMDKFKTLKSIRDSLLFSLILCKDA